MMLSLNSVLNIEMNSFRIRSACDPMIFQKICQTVSKSHFFLSHVFLAKREEYTDLLARKSLLHRNLP